MQHGICVRAYTLCHAVVQLCCTATVRVHVAYSRIVSSHSYYTHTTLHEHRTQQQVQQLVSLVYTLAEVVLDKTVREILMREGIAPISAKGFYEFYKDGEHRHRLYNEIMFIRGIEIVNEIDKVMLHIKLIVLYIMLLYSNTI